MHAQNAILSVDKLRVSFEEAGKLVAVNNVSFAIEKGKTLAIAGESGSGKSLTALALMGLLPTNAILSGDIVLNGKYLRNADDWRRLRGKETGMIFQEPMSSLNPIMKIGKQISEAIIAHQNVSGHDAKQAALEWLQKVQLATPGIYDQYPHQLSGGQKQRVMIAMAMCNSPSLLIADEPTTALDVTVQQEVVSLMKKLQQEYGTAMIFITHDLGLAGTIADEMLVMHKGEVVEYNSADTVLNRPKEPYTKALLACRPTLQQKNKRLPVVSDFLDAGSDKDQPNNESEYQRIIQGNVILEVNNLKIWFAQSRNFFSVTNQYFKAVEDVSFVLKKGEILGLVGESGCGKSTLSRSLMGLLPVTSGQIIFKDEDLVHLPHKEWAGIRRQIQMIFQDPYSSLNPRMNIGDMLMEPMVVHNIVPKSELKKEAQRLLDIVHLPKDAMKRYPHQFSGGQRQRVNIARALALRPELLICDESVSALDVSIQAQILNLLKELQQEFQLSYLFISHNLSVVHYMSDRVMVMKAGSIVESGDAEQVLKHPVNDYTKRLIEAVPQ